MAIPATGLDEMRISGEYLRLLRDDPELERPLRSIVDWETDHPPEYPSHGWEWQSVNTAVGVINRLIAADLVDLKYKSRGGASYRLRSLEAAREALENLSYSPEPLPMVKPDELFSLVVGHERVKAGLKYALAASKPVHSVLIGPPGTAKSLILSEIGRLPGACFYVGSTTSKAGLVDMLISDQPRYLVIDELDKMATVDMSPLLNLMETGFVSRLIHGNKVSVKLTTAVFAGANDVTKIRPEIMSRFAKFEVPAYTRHEFVQIAAAVLQRVHGVDAHTAATIAVALRDLSMDIRDAVRVAHMAKGNADTVPDVIACLFGQSPQTARAAVAVRR